MQRERERNSLKKRKRRKFARDGDGGKESLGRIAVGGGSCGVEINEHDKLRWSVWLESFSSGSVDVPLAPRLHHTP